MTKTDKQLHQILTASQTGTKPLLLVGLVFCASCSGSHNSTSQNKDTLIAESVASVPSIEGQWQIENVVENDSSYVRPSEIGEGVTAIVDFRKDHSFGVMTNCNYIGGQFTQSNDSIRLRDISTTEMACDNMELEVMLKKVLPLVNSIDCINDSITRLNSSKGDTYIVLRKTPTEIK